MRALIISVILLGITTSLVACGDQDSEDFKMSVERNSIKAGSTKLPASATTMVGGMSLTQGPGSGGYWMMGSGVTLRNQTALQPSGTLTEWAYPMTGDGSIASATALAESINADTASHGVTAEVVDSKIHLTSTLVDVGLPGYTPRRAEVAANSTNYISLVLDGQVLPQPGGFGSGTDTDWTAFPITLAPGAWVNLVEMMVRPKWGEMRSVWSLALQVPAVDPVTIEVEVTPAFVEPDSTESLVIQGPAFIQELNFTSAFTVEVTRLNALVEDNWDLADRVTVRLRLASGSLEEPVTWMFRADVQ